MKTIPWDEIYRTRFTPEQRKEIEARANQMMAEMLLTELREQTGKSQTEVAKALGVKQPSLSKMEKQSDMKLSSLSNYAAALGGRLKLVVELPDHPPVVIALPSEIRVRKKKPGKRVEKPPLRRKAGSPSAVKP